MANTTSAAPQTWLPSATGNLVIQPVQAESVAIQAVGSTVAPSGTNSYRVPIVAADPSASWVAEGAEIEVSDIDLGEETDVYHKVGGLSVISRELADDSNPAVAEQVGQGIARDIARQFDAAFFGSRGSATTPPRGLEDLEDINTISVGGTFTNGDPFTEAAYAAEGVGAPLAAFVAHPDDAVALAKLKQAAGSEVPLLGTSATEATTRVISGIPLLSSPAVEAGTVWGLPGGDRVVIAIREDVRLERDTSPFFTSDRVAIKATLRATTLFPHQAAIQKITTSGS